MDLRAILNVIKTISLMFIITSIVYLLARVSLLIMTTKYGYAVYSQSLGVNLKAIAHNLDLLVFFFSIGATSIYFKNKILPIILMILLVIFLPLHTLFRMGIEDLTEIQSNYLDGDYLVEMLYTPVSRDDISLSIFVYKKEYPLIYKVAGKEMEVFSKITDDETIKLYRDNKYEVSEDGKIITYGKFTIPIDNY